MAEGGNGISKIKLEDLLRQFKTDVYTDTATLSGVRIHKVKDINIVFVDSSGSKFVIPVDTIKQMNLSRT